MLYANSPRQSSFYHQMAIQFFAYPVMEPKSSQDLSKEEGVREQRHQTAPETNPNENLKSRC